MKGTIPIIMCDSEDGCSEYFRDDYEMGVSNWRVFVPAGWEYDPYRDQDAALCPEHAAKQTIEGEGNV